MSAIILKNALIKSGLIRSSISDDMDKPKKTQTCVMCGTKSNDSTYFYKSSNGKYTCQECDVFFRTFNIGHNINNAINKKIDLPYMNLNFNGGIFAIVEITSSGEADVQLFGIGGDDYVLKKINENNITGFTKEQLRNVELDATINGNKNPHIKVVINSDSSSIIVSNYIKNKNNNNSFYIISGGQKTLSLSDFVINYHGNSSIKIIGGDTINLNYIKIIENIASEYLNSTNEKAKKTDIWNALEAIDMKNDDINNIIINRYRKKNKSVEQYENFIFNIKKSFDTLEKTIYVPRNRNEVRKHLTFLEIK